MLKIRGSLKVDGVVVSEWSHEKNEPPKVRPNVKRDLYLRSGSAEHQVVERRIFCSIDRK